MGIIIAGINNKKFKIIYKTAILYNANNINCRIDIKMLQSNGEKCHN